MGRGYSVDVSDISFQRVVKESPEQWSTGTLLYGGSGRQQPVDMGVVGEVGNTAPPGWEWEGTVKAMKKHPEISNPFALAWYEKGLGDKPQK